MRVPQQKFAAGVASVGVVLIIAAALQAGSGDGGDPGVTDETVWVDPTGQPLLLPEDPPTITTTEHRQGTARQTPEGSTTTFTMMQTCFPAQFYSDFVYALFEKGEPLSEKALSIFEVDLSKFGVSTQQEVLDLGFGRAVTIAEQYDDPVCGDESGEVPVPEPTPYVSTTHVPYGATSTSSSSTSSTSSTVPSSSASATR